MTITVDASVFVAAARVEEAHYEASRRFLLQVQAQDMDLFCPALVLPECAAAVARPTGDAALGKELTVLIEGIPSLHLMNLDPPLARRAVQIASDHRLRGADSVYVAVAEAFNATLVTLDAEMLARGADFVTTMTPMQWMDEQEPP